jgi:hypothetical protein
MFLCIEEGFVSLLGHHISYPNHHVGLQIGHWPRVQASLNTEYLYAEINSRIGAELDAEHRCFGDSARAGGLRANTRTSHAPISQSYLSLLLA